MKPSIQANSAASGSRPRPASVGTDLHSAGIPKVVFKSKGSSSSVKAPPTSRINSIEAKTPTPGNNNQRLTSVPTASDRPPIVTSSSKPNKVAEKGSLPPTHQNQNTKDPISSLKPPITVLRPIFSAPPPMINTSSNHLDTDSLSIKDNFSTSSSPSVFEYLPRQLTQQKMIYEAVQVLLDDKFLIRRCLELGLYKAAKYHVRDWDHVIQRVTHPSTSEGEEGSRNKKEETEQSIFDALNQGPELAMVDDEESDMDVKMTQNIRSKSGKKESNNQGEDDKQQPDVDTLMDARITSMELFRHLILGLFGKDWDGDIQYSLPQDAPNYTCLEGGQALWVLGLSFYGIQNLDKALTCYHQSLYFLFLQQGYEEALFLRDMDESDASLYVLLCDKVQPYSEAYRLLGIVFTRIGDVYSQKDKVDPALHSYKAAYEFCIRVVQYYFPQYEDSVQGLQVSKEDEPDVAAALLAFAGTCKRIGAVYILQEQSKDAMTLYDRALELQTLVLGPEHVDVGKTLHDMGVAERHAGHWDYALKCYASAHKIFENCYGNEHLDTGEFYSCWHFFSWT